MSQGMGIFHVKLLFSCHANDPRSPGRFKILMIIWVLPKRSFTVDSEGQ